MALDFKCTYDLTHTSPEQKEQNKSKEIQKVLFANKVVICTVYSWIAHELQVGTSLGRRHNLVRFQI